MPFLGVIFFLEDELPPKVFLRLSRKPMVEGSDDSRMERLQGEKQGC